MICSYTPTTPTTTSQLSDPKSTAELYVVGSTQTIIVHRQWCKFYPELSRTGRGGGRGHNDVHVHVDGLLECRWLTGYSWLYFLYEWTMHGWIIPHRHRDNAVRVTAAPPGPVSWSCVTDDHCRKSINLFFIPSR